MISKFPKGELNRLTSPELGPAVAYLLKRTRLALVTPRLLAATQV